MLKAIIFDFDGVIADTFQMCLNIHRDNKRNITTKLYRDFHNGNVYESKVLKFTEKETKNFWKCYCDNVSSKHLFPVKEQISQLAKKQKIFIISSTTECVIADFLSSTGMKKYFQKIMGVETHKSKVEKFKMIFKEYRLEPKECIFVTDTLGDLREAKKVGVPTIAVTWGYHGKTRLKKGSPNLMIHDFKELVPAIDKLKN